MKVPCGLYKAHVRSRSFFVADDKAIKEEKTEPVQVHFVVEGKDMAVPDGNEQDVSL